MSSVDEKIDALAAHLDSLHTRLDSDAVERKADRARLDAMEAHHEKLRADAEHERTEKIRADSDAVAIRTRAATAAKELHEFVDAQMRCDRAYQAWGKQAPPSLDGENLKNFRIRLLTPLKQHSKRYSLSDLETIGDERVFTDVEAVIINDAVQASCEPGDAGAPLREVNSINEQGHRIRKFYGDPTHWFAEFMGGHTKFGKIVRPTPMH